MDRTFKLASGRASGYGLEHPTLLERVRAGDGELLRSSAHESIRLRQRSIVLRKAIQPTRITNEQATYELAPGAFAATMMPNTKDSAAGELAEFAAENYAGARFTRSGDLPARELVTTFGHGRHACPAMRFSIESIVAFVSKLLTRFDLESQFTDPQPRKRQIGGVARADRPCRVRYSSQRA